MFGSLGISSSILPETSITKTTSRGLLTGFEPCIFNSTSILPHTPGLTVTVLVGVIVCADASMFKNTNRIKNNPFFKFCIKLLKCNVFFILKKIKVNNLYISRVFSELLFDVRITYQGV